MALPQDGQDANGLTKVTQIPAGKELMFIDPTTNEGGIITLEDLTKQILNGLTSQAFGLDSGTQTLPAAINYLYGKLKTKISTIQTEYGYLYLKRTINTVGVYGAFENLPLNTERIEITKDFKDFNPNYSYAVVDVKSGAGPFDTVGSLWLYPNGQTMQLYKPANLSRAYITGNYVIQA